MPQDLRRFSLLEGDPALIRELWELEHHFHRQWRISHDKSRAMLWEGMPANICHLHRKCHPMFPTGHCWQLYMACGMEASCPEVDCLQWGLSAGWYIQAFLLSWTEQVRSLLSIMTMMLLWRVTVFFISQKLLFIFFFFSPNYKDLDILITNDWLSSYIYVIVACLDSSH